MRWRAVPGFILPRIDKSVSAGKKPASVLPAPVGAINSVDAPDLVYSSNFIWCGRGVQPWLRNQLENVSGRSGRLVAVIYDENRRNDQSLRI